MRAVRMLSYGNPSRLEIAEVETPEPGPNEVRIRVRAVAVNPADTKWRKGMFSSVAPFAFPHVLGTDVAGEVDKVGPETSGFGAGERIFAQLHMFHHGGYAEYALAPAGDLVRMPDGIGFDTAAAIPTSGLTGVQAVERYAKPSVGETVLITGAVGAVGRFAMFAAKRAGAKVVAAVRGQQRAEAHDIGADAAIVLGADDGASLAFDHVIDTVGGMAVAQLCRHLKAGGTITTAATNPIDPNGLAAKPVFIQLKNDPETLDVLARLVASGELAVPIAQRLPLDSASDAHRLVEQGGARGKVVLEP
jgi:NADPH:quinone reductase